MPYEVQTPVYEGPFDLLLHLILREQVDLYEISLSRIVDAYLVELEKMETLDLEITTEFLLIAATLVELKCKRLLPEDADVDLDDEFALWEERDLLIARLLDCKTFKDAAQVLGELAESASRSYPRTAGLEEQFLELAPDLLAGIDVDDLRAAYLRAMTPRPKPVVSIEHIHSVRVSVQDAVEELVDELPRMGRVTLPPPHRGVRRAPRGRGAVPGRARAVQAGLRRARPARRLRRHRDRLGRLARPRRRRHGRHRHLRRLRTT